MRRARRRALWLLLGSVTVIGVLFIGVYPIRTYLAQRGPLQQAHRQLASSRRRTATSPSKPTTSTPMRRSSNSLASSTTSYDRAKRRSRSFRASAPIQLPAVWPFTNLAKKLDPAAPSG